MDRPEMIDGRHADAAAETSHLQVAALNSKIAALPPELPLVVVGNAAQPAGARPLSRWALFFIAIAWLVTLGLGSIAACRIFYHDGANVLIWLNAFTRYIYLPAYACLALALWKRRWWLAAANLAIVVCQIFWIAPDFVRDRRFEAISTVVAEAPQTAKKARVFFANVRFENREFASLLHEIEEANPDVIVIVEYNRRWREALRSSPIMSKYIYGTGFNSKRIHDVAIFSRLPLRSETEVTAADRIVQSVLIDLGSQPLHLIGLHAPRPMDYRGNDYGGFWDKVVPLILEAPHPLVVVGDCNATQYSLVYQQLKAGGMRSAHEDRGRGYATTWPNGTEPLPPIRIDQAFLSPEVACLGIVEGEGLGSDHKPLILDVQITDQP